MNTLLLIKNWFIISTLLIMFSCLKREECFNSYEKFINSSYYKGGWVSDKILSKSAKNICIINDLDVNKVWLSYSYKNRNFINQNIIYKKEREVIKNKFQIDSNYFKMKLTYWEEPNIIYGKISKHEFYAVDKVKNKFYYLSTGY